MQACNAQKRPQENENQFDLQTSWIVNKKGKRNTPDSSTHTNTDQ
jgi:hypothetical protein